MSSEYYFASLAAAALYDELPLDGGVEAYALQIVIGSGQGHVHLLYGDGDVVDFDVNVGQ